MSVGLEVEVPALAPTCDRIAHASRTFRIDARLRRSTLYVVVGGWICLGTTWWLNAQGALPPGRSVVVPVMLFVVGPAALCTYVWSYRLRFDEFGLWRRRLWFWTLWPWERFKAGDVFFLSEPGACLYCRNQPIWDRLMFPVLDPTEGAFFFEVVKHTIPAECWPERKPIALPEEHVREVTLRIFPWRTMLLDVGGITIGHGERLSWDQIAQLRVEKRRNKSYSIFRITLSPRVGRPTCGSITEVRLNDTWIKGIAKGDDNWVGRLKSIVPSQLWTYLRMDGPLTSAADAEYRITHWENVRRIGSVFRWGSLLMLPLTAVLFVPKMLAVWNQPFMAQQWKIIALVCFCLTMFTQPFLLYLAADLLVRSGKGKIEETKAELARLSAREAGESGYGAIDQ